MRCALVLKLVHLNFAQIEFRSSAIVAEIILCCGDIANIL